jgi:hypothetical protein
LAARAGTSLRAEALRKEVRAAFARIGVRVMYLPVRGAFVTSPLDNTLFATFKRCLAQACDAARAANGGQPARASAAHGERLVREALACITREQVSACFRHCGLDLSESLAERVAHVRRQFEPAPLPAATRDAYEQARAALQRHQRAARRRAPAQ